RRLERVSRPLLRRRPRWRPRRPRLRCGRGGGGGGPGAAAGPGGGAAAARAPLSGAAAGSGGEGREASRRPAAARRPPAAARRWLRPVSDRRGAIRATPAGRDRDREGREWHGRVV